MDPNILEEMGLRHSNRLAANNETEAEHSSHQGLADHANAASFQDIRKDGADYARKARSPNWIAALYASVGC